MANTVVGTWCLETEGIYHLEYANLTDACRLLSVLCRAPGPSLYAPGRLEEGARRGVAGDTLLL